ncbi:MAG: DUF423 domain-containing protein, partial [Aeoliella sp.]
MRKLSRRWIAFASVLGALAVVFGAFGAHGVPSYLEGRSYDDAAIAERLGDFETAAQYQMYGALFLLGMG